MVVKAAMAPVSCSPRAWRLTAWCCVAALLAAAVTPIAATSTPLASEEYDTPSSGRRLTQSPQRRGAEREVDAYHYIFSADCKPYMAEPGRYRPHSVPVPATSSTRILNIRFLD